MPVSFAKPGLWAMLAAALILGMLAAAVFPPEADGRGPEIVGVASVIDGDTIEIHDRRIRLRTASIGTMTGSPAKPCPDLSPGRGPAFGQAAEVTATIAVTATATATATVKAGVRRRCRLPSSRPPRPMPSRGRSGFRSCRCCQTQGAGPAAASCAPCFDQ